MKTRAWILLASVTAAAAFLACSSSTEETSDDPDATPDPTPSLDGGKFDSTPSEESGLGEILFRPDEVYSGVDGTHGFDIPLAVYDADDDVTVTASDPAALGIQPAALVTTKLPDGTSDNGRYFMLTAKKAGTFTLTASSKGRTTTAKVNIAQYAADRFAAGEKRYTQAGAGDTQPCTNCHVNGMAIDHSPSSMASADDEKLAAVFLTGIKPNNTPIKGVEGNHQWSATETERDGLVTYLRAIKPKGFK